MKLFLQIMSEFIGKMCVLALVIMMFFTMIHYLLLMAP